MMIDENIKVEGNGFEMSLVIYEQSLLSHSNDFHNSFHDTLLTCGNSIELQFGLSLLNDARCHDLPKTQWFLSIMKGC